MVAVAASYDVDVGAAEQGYRPAVGQRSTAVGGSGAGGALGDLQGQRFAGRAQIQRPWSICARNLAHVEPCHDRPTKAREGSRFSVVPRRHHMQRHLFEFVRGYVDGL